MNDKIKLGAVLILSAAISTAYASTSERLKATGENIKGTTQEVTGDVTGDPELQAKGKANKTKSKLRHTKEDVKDLITD